MVKYKPQLGQIRPPVDKSKLYYQSGFLKELKIQIPGLTLSVSHLHNKVKEIEKILDESISL